MRSRCYQWSVSRAIALPSALPYASAIDSVSTLSKGNHEGYPSHAVQNGTMVTPFTAPLIALSRGNVAVDRRPELLAEGPESPQLSCVLVAPLSISRLIPSLPFLWLIDTSGRGQITPCSLSICHSPSPSLSSSDLCPTTGK